jgi:hypothetical protein
VEVIACFIDAGIENRYGDTIHHHNFNNIKMKTILIATNPEYAANLAIFHLGRRIIKLRTNPTFPIRKRYPCANENQTKSLCDWSADATIGTSQ